MALIIFNPVPTFKDNITMDNETTTTFSETLYQWRTTNGAVAQEFFTREAADKWMERRKLNQQAEPNKFYPELKLKKITTTTEITDL